MTDQTFVATWYADSCPISWTDVVERDDDREVGDCPANMVTTVRSLASVRIVGGLSSSVHSGSPQRAEEFSLVGELRASAVTSNVSAFAS